MRLPLSLYSSGRGPDRVFEIGDERERVEVYQIVLTEVTEDDVCRYVDRDELQRLWPRLWLPEHVREAWESRLAVAANAVSLIRYWSSSRGWLRRPPHS